jgi:hypothetical protein
VKANYAFVNTDGIMIIGCRNLIEGNIAISNEDDGIDVRTVGLPQNRLPCEYNVIRNNTVGNNTDFGISIGEDCSFNSITFNDLLMNGQDHQVHDDSVNSTVDSNYYSNWYTPDDDHNGIVDDPCPVHGIASNHDWHPLAAPCNPVPEWYILPHETTSTTTPTTHSLTPTSPSTSPTTPDDASWLPVALIATIGIGGILVIVLVMTRRK